MQIKKNNKIINDPIYGLISIENGIILNLINHPYFQRLRRISQLGLVSLVYPSANHSRFQHAIGSMFLMNKAIIQLKNKGHEITKEEEEALKIAILLHDIGHGPFSHALEYSLVSNVSHENISSLFMHRLNEEFDGKLSLAINIFHNNYKKNFLHQLVSSQLDIDRLDYLRRDSFFTGVKEGDIGSDRIINILNVINDKLVIEEKGIYSIEKFLIARRIMYWQVYLHKTVISSENILINTLKRAKELILMKKKIFTTPALKIFLFGNLTKKDILDDKSILDNFSTIDDNDIYTCMKCWSNYDDFILSKLSKMILNRELLKIELRDTPFNDSEKEIIKNKVINKYQISEKEAKYIVFSNKVINHIYNTKESAVNILTKKGEVIDITKVSDQLNIDTLNNTEKYFLCYPGDI